MFWEVNLISRNRITRYLFSRWRVLLIPHYLCKFFSCLSLLLYILFLSLFFRIILHKWAAANINYIDGLINRRSASILVLFEDIKTDKSTEKDEQNYSCNHSIVFTWHKTFWVNGIFIITIPRIIKVIAITIIIRHLICFWIIPNEIFFFNVEVFIQNIISFFKLFCIMIVTSCSFLLFFCILVLEIFVNSSMFSIMFAFAIAAAGTS